MNFSTILKTGPVFILLAMMVATISALFVPEPANGPLSSAQTRTDEVDFNRDIRPILSNHCFACHGPDSETREADLRLDIPDDVDFSEVIRRIKIDDRHEVMPPPATGKPLSEKQIADLTSWVEQGAKHEVHWAFKVPVKQEVPAESHPVDFFIDRQLERHGLTRSVKAEPAIVIRRLYLDLIGVPPPVDVADQFIANPTDEAYQAIVDQLLASPRYGERWARRWLDLARYADTNGFEKDRDRSIWPYRDWVIRALNADMPFDQFTIEQIAGDMLPNATIDQMVATGFHRNTMLNEEGGIDPLEYRYMAMVDRVATTGTTWLGLTVGCAQCHTHKYDPIDHDEYFGLLAFLNNADEPDFVVANEKSRAVRKANLSKARSQIEQLATHWPKTVGENENDDFETAFKKWLTKESKNRADWKTIDPVTMTSNLPYLSKESDGIIFASGDITKHDTYKLSFPAQSEELTAIRLEALPDSRLPEGGPGLTYYEGRKGDFFLAEIALHTDSEQRVAWSTASETFAKNQFGDNRVAAELAIDGDFQSGWSVASRSGFKHAAVFNLEHPLPAGKPFTITMEFGRHFASPLGKFRLSVAKSEKPLTATVLSDEEAQLLSLSNATGNKTLQERFLMQAPQVETQAEEIRNLLRSQNGDLTMVMQERPKSNSRKTHLHHRGEFTQPKHEVSPKIPAALLTSEQKAQPTNRLEFAEWLVSKENPLTARVVANRHWAAFFGAGLVATLDDFGMQGAHPSHPNLLDHLAITLIENDWSIKKFHRMIVTSETYQQSSNFDSEHEQAKRLLQRFPRKRLEAEIIRDVALAASGLLDLKMYGPPVRPPQPAGAAANFQSSTWQVSSGSDRYRRSVYTYQKRTAPFEMFTTFDATSGESCVARRDVSNTPLQALTLMNDPMFLEISEAFGKRMESHPGDESEKIKAGFRWLLTRSPDADEIEMLTRFLQTHKDWSALARVLLCLDESINQN